PSSRMSRDSVAWSASMPRALSRSLSSAWVETARVAITSRRAFCRSALALIFMQLNYINMQTEVKRKRESRITHHESRTRRSEEDNTIRKRNHGFRITNRSRTGLLLRLRGGEVAAGAHPFLAALRPRRARLVHLAHPVAVAAGRVHVQLGRHAR